LIELVKETIAQKNKADEEKLLRSKKDKKDKKDHIRIEDDMAFGAEGDNVVKIEDTEGEATEGEAKEATEGEAKEATEGEAKDDDDEKTTSISFRFFEFLKNKMELKMMINMDYETFQTKVDILNISNISKLSENINYVKMLVNTSIESALNFKKSVEKQVEMVLGSFFIIGCLCLVFPPLLPIVGTALLAAPIRLVHFAVASSMNSVRKYRYGSRRKTLNNEKVKKNVSKRRGNRLKTIRKKSGRKSVCRKSGRKSGRKSVCRKSGKKSGRKSVCRKSGRKNGGKIMRTKTKSSGINKRSKKC
jgi:UPF0716 family protein affecting phage T7 exclusion